MKTSAKISVLLNVVLLIGLSGVLLIRHPAEFFSVPAVVTPPQTPATEPAASVPPTIARTGPAPFRWSQLASSDFHVYVNNLRKSGCPETTIRAIVTADLDAVCRRRSLELEQRIDEIENGSWAVQLGSFNEQLELKAQLKILPGQEYSEICDLMGLKPAASDSQFAIAPNTRAVRGPQSTEQDHAIMPLVFQQVNLDALELNEQQIQVVSQLQQEFIAKIGGPNQDPGDPAYRVRWQKAQPEMDDNLRGMLGVSVFENYQLAAQDPPASGN